MGFYDLVPLLSHGCVAPLSHPLLPSLQPSKFGVLSQACHFLECSFFPVLPGDVLLNLQTQLQFPFLEEASPDLFRQSWLLPSLDVLIALFIWVKIPKDWTLREWHYWKPEPVGLCWVSLVAHTLQFRRPGFDPGFGLGRSPGEGNGYPLQYSCLENSMDRGAWRATVQRVAKSQTQLSN